MSALDEIIASFDMLAPADRLAWLIEFGESLPPLAEIHHADRDAGKFIVHECQAPVFLKTEVVRGTLKIHVDVPREAPVARGFVGLLVAAFDNRPIANVADAPMDLLKALHIWTLLGMQRQNGLSAIYRTLKTQMQRTG